MARQLFVESCWIEPGKVEEVKNLNTVPKKIRESYDHAVKTRASLNESKWEAPSTAKIDSILRKHNLSEEAIGAIKKDLANNIVISESGGAKRLWKFPISKVNDAQHKNLNERSYTLPLWENVVYKQTSKWKGRCGLADHPQGDKAPSFKDQGILWLGAEIDKENLDEETGLPIIYGYGVFVGPYGHMAEEIIDYGGGCGFSTSGWGDFLADGFTIDPETYEIERLADMVLDPSQGVFGYATDVVENIEKVNANTMHESIEKKDNKIKEENDFMKKSPKATVGVLAGYYNNTLKEIKEMKSTEKRMAAYDEMISDIDTFEEEWLDNEGAKIKEIREEVKSLLEKEVQHYSEISEVADNFEGTAEELNAALAEAKANEEDLNEIRKVIGTSTKQLASAQKENAALHEKVENMTLSYNEDMAASKKEIRSLKAESANMNEELDAAAGIVRQLNRAIRNLKEKNADLERKLRISENRNRKLNRELDEMDQEIAAKDRTISTLRESVRTAGQKQKITEAQLAHANNVIGEYTGYTTSVEHENETGDIFTEESEIRAYIADLKETGTLSPKLESRMLHCKTLSEAQKVWARNQNFNFLEDEECDDEDGCDEEGTENEEDEEFNEDVLNRFVDNF